MREGASNRRATSAVPGFRELAEDGCYVAQFVRPRRARVSCAMFHEREVDSRREHRPPLVSDSVALMLPLMKERGARRMVVMSNLWAGESGAWGMRKIGIPLFARWLLPILADKDRMEAILRASDGVEWVAPRFPEIVEGPAKPLKSSPDGRGISMKITTGSIATFMLDHLSGETHVGETPAVSN